VPLVSGALPLKFKSKKSSYGFTSKLADKMVLLTGKQESEHECQHRGSPALP